MATNGLNLQSTGLKLTSGTVERMIIESDGQFGFGTVSPSTDFHFVGSGATTGLRFQGLPSASSNGNFLVVDGNGVVQTRSDIATGTVVTAVTESNNVITVDDNQGVSTDLTIDALTTLEYDSSWGLTLGGTGTVSSSFELPFITAGSYDAGTGTITLSINGGVESDITITGLDGADTFVTGSSYSNGTLTLTRNDAATITQSGLAITLAADSGVSETVNLGDTLTVAGGTGLSSVVSASDTVTLNLDNTAVSAGSYGDADSVATFTVDAQGRLTAAASVDINITASQVSDFDAEVLSSVFEAANFVDSSEVDFTVTAGASVTAALIDGSIANARLVNSGVSTAGTTGTGSLELGGTLSLGSADGSLVITDNGGGSLDFSVDVSSVDSFVTGATLASGTLTLSLNNGQPDVTASGFQYNLSADSGVGQVVQLGDTLTLAGGTGISSVGSATDTVTFNLDNTTVTAGSYGAANTVGTFTVDAQGRLTAASDVTIDITASQVSDFDTEALSSVFEAANFVDSSEIDFTVTAGASVTAALIDGSIANARLANSSISTVGTSGSGSVSLGGTVTFISTDSSVTIDDNGTGTFDIQVSDANIDNIYTSDGTLGGNRAVTQNGNSLAFRGGDFEVDGTLYIDASQDSVGVGESTPDASAVLEVSSTTKGFLFPRMTEAQRTSIGSPATGLLVYQTDGEEGVYIYKSFGWVQMI